MHKGLDMRWIEGVGCWAPNIFTVSASTQSLFLSFALQIITYYAYTFQITTQGKFCTKHQLLNTRTQVLIFIPHGLSPMGSRGMLRGPRGLIGAFRG